MKKYFLSTFIFLLSGCVTTKVGGDFLVAGTVIDSESKLPVENASVFIEQHAGTAFNLNGAVRSKVVYTDKYGRFQIYFEKVKLIGGTGGVAGYIGKHPYIRFMKEGYYTKHSRSIDGKNDNNLTLTLYRPNLSLQGNFCKKIHEIKYVKQAITLPLMIRLQYLVQRISNNNNIKIH